MLVRILFALAFITTLASRTFGQDVESVDFHVEGDKIIVKYDLLYCERDYVYDVALYYWQDGQVNRAYAIEGDVQGQECGAEKKLTWDVLSDVHELQGMVKMEVRKVAEHKITRQKEPRKKDHGYIGIMIGGFTPYKNFSPQGYYPLPSDNLQSAGASAELTASWLGRRQGIMGYTTSIRLSTTDFTDSLMVDKTGWVNGSFTCGPLFSFPLSKRIVWDLRPMLGYSHTFVISRSESSLYYTTEDEPMNAGSLCLQLGTVVRLNMAKWLNLVFAADYFQTQPKFFDNSINMNYLTFSFGCGIRF